MANHLLVHHCLQPPMSDHSHCVIIIVPPRHHRFYSHDHHTLLTQLVLRYSLAYSDGTLSSSSLRAIIALIRSIIIHNFHSPDTPHYNSSSPPSSFSRSSWSIPRVYISKPSSLRSLYRLTSVYVYELSAVSTRLTWTSSLSVK